VVKLARFFNAATGKQSSVPIDWIIILGGTNDLGYGRSQDRIFSSLKKVYNIAFQHGANILALTIPECSAKNANLDRRRNAVNEMILGYKPDEFEKR
jgi:hypothetical protein